MTQCGSRLFVYSGDYISVNEWISTCIRWKLLLFVTWQINSLSPTSWIPLNYLDTEKTYTYLYGYCVYNQLQNKNHRCQYCKQIHGNSVRITTALCHLTAVFDNHGRAITIVDFYFGVFDLELADVNRHILVQMLRCLTDCSRLDCQVNLFLCLFYALLIYFCANNKKS